MRLPSVVLEIVAGIVVGPSLLGIVEVDQTIEVIALIGLGFVLFLAGLEIEFEKLRGQVLRLTALGFALSFAIAWSWRSGWRPAGWSRRRCSWRSSSARPRWRASSRC